MRRMTNRIISIFLCIALVTSLLSGCGKNEVSSDELGITVTGDGTVFENGNGMIEIDTDKIVETVSNEIQYAISMNWEDYVGDIETFVYGLVINELGYKYDVFPASVKLSDGYSIFGIAYTDYQECYTNDDESMSYFTVGFIPGIGELTIPEEDFNSGLLVENLDYHDDKTQFVLKYQSEAFSEHCVVYNQYVTYGVDADGRLFYEAEQYEHGKCDESIGSLYSYDESRYVYDVDLGEYVNISGEPLASQMDYVALEEEINRILENQDANFTTVDVETSVYFAQEAVTNYLLSFQEETFLGYDVKSLVEAASALDPMECYRITSDGLMTIDLEYATEDEVARWLVGAASVIVVAVGMVGSIVFIECPPLSAVASAIAGTGIEVFMQVVVSNQKVSDIEWSKVAIAACTGAVSGYLGPYIMATTGGAVNFFVDSALDGLLGGIEQTIYAWMDGSDGAQMIESFGYGFTLGFGLSAGFKGAGAVLGKIAKKLAPTIKETAEKVFPKLSKRVSDLAGSVGDKIYELKRAEDATVFQSEYLSKKLSFKQLERLIQVGDSSLKKMSFDNLKKEGILDVNDKPITKKELEELFDKAADGDIIGSFRLGDDVIKIKKKNGRHCF